MTEIFLIANPRFIYIHLCFFAMENPTMAGYDISVLAVSAVNVL